MTVNLEQFLAQGSVCFDVRSPKEFQHAHISGAISLPLFSDVERAVVGTAYKQQGKDIAVRLGIKLIGPKLDSLLTQALEHVGASKSAKVYCWRGEMRSGFVRYFLEFAGIQSVQLKGGYKTYRRLTIATLEKPCLPFLIGGLTGSGKTEVLQELSKQNAQTIDLEALAHHRGSVYGELAGILQPSSEQFENELACSLLQKNLQSPIWVEDESRLIGHCQIPTHFYEAMKRAPLFVINCPKEARIERIMSIYSTLPKEQLKAMTIKLTKRLGGASTKTALTFIEQGLLQDAVSLLLEYYDKAYEHAILKHKGPVTRLPEHNLTASGWAKVLLEIQDQDSISTTNPEKNELICGP
ncbi:MAG: tRNA 2-selenouridine(34) synthase MnmH [Chlamydiales bacterium]|nr:tRNA 2-selenouridine(34) synthase MnmH [Chlamydiales bacterium]